MNESGMPQYHIGMQVIQQLEASYNAARIIMEDGIQRLEALKDAAIASPTEGAATQALVEEFIKIFHEEVRSFEHIMATCTLLTTAPSEAPEDDNGE